MADFEIKITAEQGVIIFQSEDLLGVKSKSDVILDGNVAYSETEDPVSDVVTSGVINHATVEGLIRQHEAGEVENINLVDAHHVSRQFEINPILTELNVVPHSSVKKVNIGRYVEATVEGVVADVEIERNIHLDATD